MSLVKATGWTFEQIGEMTWDAKKSVLGWDPDKGYVEGADVITFATEREYAAAIAKGLFKGKPGA